MAIIYNVLILGALAAAAAAPVWTQVCSDPQFGSQTVDVDGVKLSLADLERRRPSILYQARNAFYEAQRKAVDEMIDGYLLEREAVRAKLSVDQLLQRELTAAIGKDPSDEALRVYFEGLDIGESFESVRGKILDHLRQRRIARAKTAYVQNLRKQAKIAIQLAPPRTQVALEGTPVRGRADAPVLVVEYADYECPYCQQIQPVLDKLAAAYPDKVAFAYKDVPLPMHPAAQKAAEAAHCAGAQGKYWQYHSSLLSGKDLDIAKLKDRARQFQLDGAAFDKCLDSGEKAGVIQKNLAEAQGLGIQGTPSFIINGRFFSGVLTYEKLREIVEEELATKAGQFQSAAGL